MISTFDIFNKSFSPEKQYFSNHSTFSSSNIWATRTITTYKGTNGRILVY